MHADRFEALCVAAADKGLHVLIHTGAHRRKPGSDHGRIVSRLSAHDGKREIVGVNANDNLPSATRALLEKIQALQSA